MSRFELALEVETKQPIDLTIPKKRGTLHEGNDETKKMAKEYEERKTWAIKLLEKRMQVTENKPTSCLGTLNSKWGPSVVKHKRL